MPKFEVTIERKVVHVAKIMIEAIDEDAACKAAALRCEEEHGTTKSEIEWELEYEDFDTIECYEEPNEEPDSEE